MTAAVICSALLGLLVFGLGFAVSSLRGMSNTNIGHSSEPTDSLHKWVRAHANAAEYAPMLAILVLLLGARQPAAWLIVVFAVATACRYIHAAGMILGATLDRPNPARFIGALGTYLCGFVLAAAALMT